MLHAEQPTARASRGDQAGTIGRNTAAGRSAIQPHLALPIGELRSKPAPLAPPQLFISPAEALPKAAPQGLISSKGIERFTQITWQAAKGAIRQGIGVVVVVIAGAGIELALLTIIFGVDKFQLKI